MFRTEDLYIKEIKALPSPDEVKARLPLNDALAETIAESRNSIGNILLGEDDRMLVILGPCSVHDLDATLEYAEKLRDLQNELQDRALLVMRTYFEKPRTTIGWKGMLYDPHLDRSDDIETGIFESRKILLEVAKLGLPAATEILEPIAPQFLCDLVSWAAIGARTAESQIHRQMASGLSMPIGFKNSTDGNLHIAIEAIRAAREPHAFLGIDSKGRAGVARTNGNPYGHVVLRGGHDGPNYMAEYVAFINILLKKAHIPCGVIIDCSHANSGKQPEKQGPVFDAVIEQRREGSTVIRGVMLESFLEKGNQPISPDKSKLRYGQSITDACMDWAATADILRRLK
ncbi:MAG: 3-deoxy-7-phosphoheptulonate synthase [Candidatus Sumerlaeota bacterium]